MSESASGISSCAPTRTLLDLTHHAIDTISAALLQTQLLLRNLAPNDPAIERLRYTVTQLVDAGATLCAVRDTLRP